MAKLLSFILLSHLLIACNNETITAAAHEDDREALIRKLEEHNVWYRIEDDNRFTFKLADESKIAKIGQEIYEEIAPEGRSEILVPGVEEILLRKLAENRIKYEIRKYKEDKIIVWEEKNDIKVLRILEESRKEFSDKMGFDKETIIYNAMENE